MTFSLTRRLAAERLGTGVVVGSGVMGERLAGGNIALALLGDTLPTGALAGLAVMRWFFAAQSLPAGCAATGRA